MPSVPETEGLLAEAYSDVGPQDEAAIQNASPVTLNPGSLQQASATEIVAFLSAFSFEPKELAGALLEGIRAENALKQANASYIEACAKEKERRAEQIEIENQRLKAQAELDRRRLPVYFVFSVLGPVFMVIIIGAYFMGWVPLERALLPLGVSAFLSIPEKSFNLLSGLLSWLVNLLPVRGK